METQARYDHAPIAEMTGGIILANFKRSSAVADEYQSEAQLEERLIAQLEQQGYERLHIHEMEDLYTNLKAQIERLNAVTFTPAEWRRFLAEYLDAPNDGIIEKTRKVQEDHVYDFTFDDGHVQNIRILDKKHINNNRLQVTSQVSQHGQYHNRYDVTILVNGLPLVHVELKKRGVNIREAFYQIHRYSRESFNLPNSLYKYVQIFVISNGTYTRYFANTTAQSKNNYEFTCEWADAKNHVIHDLEDFTGTFFERRVLLEVLTKYCVFNTTNTLLIMRPYQIAATERILWKIRSSYENKRAGTVDAGGFVWHTTGSGKTLTSFKAARLATELKFIDKVFFVVDRKDLDHQTMKEYQNFQPDSVNGSRNTHELKRSIEKEDDRIVVTTIQKLNEFVKKNPHHPIYDRHCVLIYDECHRSQFGEAQKNIRKAFHKYYQFGFTGTPIFPENSLGAETTAGIFGAQLHSYVITDAIRDGKVLKFKVDYTGLVARAREAEREQDIERLKGLEQEVLMAPTRIAEVTRYVLRVFDTKTHRNEYYDLKNRRLNGFNAMMAVQSIPAAAAYYREFARQQEELPADKRLKVATIFSYAANEAPVIEGDIREEGFNPNALDLTSKEFLEQTMADYNRMFATNFSPDGQGFQNYYRDLSERVKQREVDLLIVVGMFLTGFDAPTLNTLFVDKNLRYHGLIQAFSRTNRILNKVKTFGNIVCFRDLEKATEDAIKIFGDKNSLNVILEKSYAEYIEGFVDALTGEAVKGFREICRELAERFAEPTEIVTEADKKEFAQLFGEYLKRQNILRNFDEFADFDSGISERQEQDMRSVYIKIVEEKQGGREKKPGGDPPIDSTDWGDVEFHIDLLKTDEINLDYILALILEKSREHQDGAALREEIRRVIRSSLGTRAKESLIMAFMEATDLEALTTKEEILQAFYEYAKAQKKRDIEDLMREENLKPDARRLIEQAIRKGEVEEGGTELDATLPPVSRRQGARERKKQGVLAKMRRLVEIFVGI